MHFIMSSSSNKHFSISSKVLSSSMLKVHAELSKVFPSIWPKKVAFSMHFPFDSVPVVFFSSFSHINPFAMKFVIKKLTLILASINPFKNPFASLFPLLVFSTKFRPVSKNFFAKAFFFAVYSKPFKFSSVFVNKTSVA